MEYMEDRACLLLVSDNGTNRKLISGLLLCAQPSQCLQVQTLQRGYCIVA